MTSLKLTLAKISFSKRMSSQNDSFETSIEPNRFIGLSVIANNSLESIFDDLNCNVSLRIVHMATHQYRARFAISWGILRVMSRNHS